MFLTNLKVFNLVKLQKFTIVLLVEFLEIPAVVGNLILFKVY